ncbi:MAG: hypothetical protein WCQ20_05115 [Synechococcaceae cyanobacterium ELA739]
MKSLLRLTLLPMQAPMLLLLFAISTYLGMHWSRPIELEASQLASLGTLIWSAECLQALVVVLVCTMPDLLLRQVSNLMAASRVVSLVVTLLLVITGGLYMLHLDVFSNVLILGSAVLLARLDLARIRVQPSPLLLAMLLSLLVLSGAGLGRILEARYHPNSPHVQAGSSGTEPSPSPSPEGPGSAEAHPKGAMTPASEDHPTLNRALPHVGQLRTAVPKDPAP